MKNTKETFLQRELVALLRNLKDGARGKWGMLSAQEMVERFADAVKNASGKLVFPFLNEEERLEKSRQFLMSEEPFKENVKIPLIPEEGFRLRKPNIEAALNKLQKELDYFFELFEKHPDIKTNNPYFGQLDYDMNVQLLYKHAHHHLQQFGLV
jgi:hypothetical protein